MSLQSESDISIWAQTFLVKFFQDQMIWATHVLFTVYQLYAYSKDLEEKGNIRDKIDT